MKQGKFIISADPSAADAQALLEDAADAGPDAELRPFAIAATQHGDRLDRALAALAPEFSRSYLQQLIEAGAVSFHGAPVTKSSHKVKAGDEGVIELRPTPQSQAFRPEPMALEIVFEDEHLLVVNKPAGLVVHPAPGNWSGTLLNGLLARDSGAMLLPRAGIVHRLDKDTSGLMVVAKTRPAMDALVRMIAAREVSRQYLALGHRRWTGPSPRDIVSAIGRDPRNRLRMAVVDLERDAGKTAGTTLDLLESTTDACLVQATLHTGRTHQIRVHMASIGHPLVGDALYGGAPGRGIERQALHAWRLALRHPVTNEELDLRSALPRDLREGLAAWGLRYNPVPAMAPVVAPVPPNAR